MATSAPAPNPQLSFDSSTLPISQLESLRFKANQIIESIQLLQRTIEMGGQPVMPAWPDIISKYNILLSQSHSISSSLLAAHQAGGAAGNPFARLALHPRVGMTDAQLDNELIPLLRNQQTTDVLRIESDTVRHLAEHMATRGALGVLAPPLGPGVRRTENEDVLSECAQIREAHDARVDRAVRAVALLREKYDWHARVAVDQEEPEELEWDPRLQGPVPTKAEEEAEAAEAAEGMSESEGAGESNDSEEEEELEEVLGNGADHSPDDTPGGGGPITPVPQG